LQVHKDKKGGSVAKPLDHASKVRKKYMRVRDKKLQKQAGR